MIILLYGSDTYRSSQKVKEIIKEYQTKHQSGLNLICFKPGEADWSKLKEVLETTSMFAEKKLVVLEDFFDQESQLAEFFTYAQQTKLKKNQEIILVIWQKGGLKKKQFKSRVNLFEEFKPLEGSQLSNWLNKEITRQGGQIEPLALKRLIASLGNDLWQLTNEAAKLISYAQGRKITEKDIHLLVRAKIDLSIFQTLDALALRNKGRALKLLHQHLAKGENEIYLLTMFIYQLRNLLCLKDLVVQGTPFYSLAGQSGLHPYVVKKSWSALKNFSLDQLKKIYQRLLDFEIAVKTGRLEPLIALEMLIWEI